MRSKDDSFLSVLHEYDTLHPGLCGQAYLVINGKQQPQEAQAYLQMLIDILLC